MTISCWSLKAMAWMVVNSSDLSGRTSLIIAHRQSTIQKANRIVSIDLGRIVEVGDHRTLLERHGLYARLYEQQTSHASAGSAP